jgi:predicted nucleotidyltransferase
MSESPEAVQERYRAALDVFVEKVRQDPYVIAAILCGSLSHDKVWHRSDIDVVLVGRSEKHPVREYALVEDNINIHALMFSRSRFKQILERSVQSSFFHSYLSKSTLLYTNDESLRDYYADITRLGAADRDIALLGMAGQVAPMLTKAEKWLYAKRDPAYSYLWVQYMLSALASIEVLLNNEITGREVVQQAMKYNPDFFNAIYFDLLDRPKDIPTVTRVLETINAYVDEHSDALFGPVLEYLAAAGGPRTVTEVTTFFEKRMQSPDMLVGNVLEWLAYRGTIQQLATPLRLTEKSRPSVDEATYFYDPEH